jgi:hypothetical protein
MLQTPGKEGGGTEPFLPRDKVHTHPLGHSLLASLPGSRGAVAGLRPDGSVVISDSAAYDDVGEIRPS